MSVSSPTSSFPVPDPRPGDRRPWVDLQAMVGLAGTCRPGERGDARRRPAEDEEPPSGDLTELAARLTQLFK